MPHRRVCAPLLLCIVAITVSCLQTGRPAAVGAAPTATLPAAPDTSHSAGPATKREALTLDAVESGDAASARPFGVVFAGPRGSSIDPTEITVVFNRPMRPLSLAGGEKAPPVSLVLKGTAAAPKGTWRWMGTSALIFAPDGRLPRASTYVVTVPVGTKALDGSALASPYTFEFSTAVPKLVRIDPPEGEEHLVPTSTFDLRFNQAVDPAEVERAVTLAAGDGAGRKVLPFRATRPKADVAGLVRVTPSVRLPLGTTITIDVAPSLHGSEGPLPLEEGRRVAFETYGPLAVTKLDCSTYTPNGKCDAHGYVALRLSNQVPLGSWKAHLRLEGPKDDPHPSLRWPNHVNDRALISAGDLDAPLKPAHAYTAVITAGLRDEYGQTLGREVRMALETDDLQPSITLGVHGSVFEAAGSAMKGRAREVPIGTVNLDRFELVTASLDESQVALFVAADDSGNPRSARGFDRAAGMKGAKLEVVHPPRTANATSLRTVSLDNLLAKTGGHGAALVAVRALTARWEEAVQLLAVSDLAISAKISRFGSVVWVTHLSDGSPVPNAKVTVRDATDVLATATTDDDGLATIPASAYSPADRPYGGDPGRIIVVRSGKDWTWRSAGDVLDPSQTGIFSELGEGLDPVGMLFTDRGIYKTGETVRLKGIFRSPLARGTATPKGEDVTLRVSDASGAELFTGTAALDAFGAFAIDVPVPESARLGLMELVAELPSNREGRVGKAQATAQIAAYRPAEFKVAVDPGRSSYVRGDRAGFAARGEYLFGAPMSGGDVRFTITRGTTSFAPPGTDGLVTDDSAYAWGLGSESPRASEMASGSGSLDARGLFAAGQTLAMPHQHGPEIVSFEAEVRDVSRQAIAGRASVIVHPAQFYLALAPPKDLFLAKGATVHAGALAVKPSGEHVAGVPVTIDLVKRTWRTAWEASGDLAHAHSSVVDTTLASCAVSSGAEVASCDLTAAEEGFFLLRATTHDPRGNDVSASAPLYVLGDGDVGWRTDDRASVELVPDKQKYEPGEVARVLVKNPFPDADALVTVERAGIYRKERVHLVGSMPTISVPITSDLRPNVFVSVHLVRGRTKDAPPTGADVGAPAFRAGCVDLTVNPESRRLKVQIAPAKRDLRPGDEVDADVVVRDRAGRPVKAGVTFYAVDEGVLMLTAYSTPDPIPTFTAPRWNNVLSIETRADLAKPFLHANSVGTDKGDEGGGGGGMRADFRATAYFEPSLVTDASGRAHVHFKLPDALTTYRLMAVTAAEDDRFGFGETRVTVSRPLMARPNLPRFLRAGDAIEAGVVLSSKGIGPAKVEVALEASGVEVVGDATRTVTLPANGNVEVRWSIRAPLAGKARFAFRAAAGREHDAVVVTRDVEVPLAPEAVALYGETTDEVTEKLGDLSGMRPDVGGLDLRLASTALVGLDDGIEQLIEYPYGCTEQLSSRLVPLVPLRALATDYHVALPGNVEHVIGETVAKIILNQRGDGGFGWWPDSRVSDPWLSAYAVWALDLARKGGAQVPDDALRDGVAYVHGHAGTLLDGRVVDQATAAFFLDVLATLGAPDYGYMSRLYDQRATLPLFARALLAHAMVLSRMDAKLARELTRDFENHLRVSAVGATVVENLGDDYAVVLDSEARTTAMVVRALLAVDPKHPLAARLAKGLLAMRKHGTWRSTQESAWALLALDDYRRAQESAVPDFDARVLIGDVLASEKAFHTKTLRSETTTIPAAALVAGGSGAGLAFEVEGEGKLFYEARLHYARRDLPTSGIDRGFFVRKVVRSVKPAALKSALTTLPETSAMQVEAGDLVLVDLVVVTQDPREQVVIDDPLPAGLEAVQATLATTARSLDVVEAGGEGDESDAESRSEDGIASDQAWSTAWFHREYRDDRVLTFVDHMAPGMYHYRYLARATTHGSFVVPPTRADCMYEPETFGRTGASVFVVSAK